jgi:hyperosmotically inducible protein
MNRAAGRPKEENRMNMRTLRMTSIGAAIACMAVVGCSKQDRAEARRDVDQVVAQTEHKTTQMANDASKEMDKAKNSMKEGAAEAKDSVSDAVITTSVKAELAKAPDLSAMKINVDTDNGRVALRGTAPSTAAKDHATALATGVHGVVGVDNELKVAKQ